MTPLLSPWWLLVFSLFLLTLRGLYSLGLRIAAKRSMTGDTRHGPVTRAVRTIDPAILALFWFSFGASVMDYQLTRNSFERQNLDVAEVYPAGNAKLIERDGGQVIYVNPCRETPMKFIPGMHFKVIRYAQMDGCKMVKYFDYDANPNGTIKTNSGEIADVR